MGDNIPARQDTSSKVDAVLSNFVRAEESQSAGFTQRAVTLVTLLQGFGKHFSRLSGTKDDYALSFAVDRFSSFLSHSWQSGRVAKCMALLYKQSMVPALIASLVGSVLVAALQVYGALGPIGYHTWHLVSKHPAPVFCGCQIFGLVTFLTTLVTWVSLSSWLGCTSSLKERIFLDKLCIRQDDPVEKQRDIDNIAAYLRNSDRLLVLWDPGYFTRLWCCFEFAVFLHRFQDLVRPKVVESTCIDICKCGCCIDDVPRESPVVTADDARNFKKRPQRIIVTPPRAEAPVCIERPKPDVTRMQYILSTPDIRNALQIVPLELSSITFAVGLSAWCISMVYNLMFLVPGAGETSPPLIMAASISFCLTMSASYGRSYCRHRSELLAQLDQFRVSTANCSLDCDRVTLTDVIGQLYLRLVGSDGGDGVSKFEEFMQTVVKDVVLEVLGPVTLLPATFNCCLSCFTIYSHMDNICSALVMSPPPEIILRLLAKYCALAAGVPCAFVIVIFMSTRLQRKFESVAANFMCNLTLAICATVPLTVAFAVPTMIDGAMGFTGAALNTALSVPSLCLVLGSRRIWNALQAHLKKRSAQASKYTSAAMASDS